MARIKTTRTVKVALWALRIYLLVLLTLIGVKFARVFSGSIKADQTAAAPPAAAAGATNPPAAEILNNSSGSLK
jgi:hypothetical protein